MTVSNGLTDKSNLWNWTEWLKWPEYVISKRLQYVKCVTILISDIVFVPVTGGPLCISQEKWSQFPSFCFCFVLFLSTLSSIKNKKYFASLRIRRQNTAGRHQLRRSACKCESRQCGQFAEAKIWRFLVGKESMSKVEGWNII